MIKDIVSIYKEDKEEFIESLVGGILIFTLTIFLFWFYGTFCYDM